MRRIHICSGALLILTCVQNAAASPSVDTLPKAYLPPQNLSIQDSIDHILTGYEAMGTYGELHRTLKVFRPTSDQADLAAMFREIEKQPLPPLRSNGLSIFTDIPGKGQLQIEVVNPHKSRFRIQGIAWTFDIRRPFAQSMAEIHSLIYKTARAGQIRLSILPSADAEEGSLSKFFKGFYEFAAGYFTQSIACEGDAACLAKLESQKQSVRAVGQDDQMSRSQSISYFSRQRQTYCLNSGQDVPKKGTQAAPNCGENCPDHSKCKSAISDYQYYCKLLKAASATKHLQILEKGSRLNFTWSKIDCEKDFRPFILRQDAPARKSNSTSPGKGL